jgi:hypothetical protein
MVGPAQDTLFREASVPGLGLGTTLQTTPSHDSTRVCCSPEVASEFPTAIQSVEETQDTALR